MNLANTHRSGMESVRRYCSLVLVLVFFGCLVLYNGNSIELSRAQTQEKTAEQVYKNIQVFRNLPASQLLGAMNFMAGSLGVSCNHCHVPNQFAKDDKPAKAIARRHLEMMQAINASDFGGKTVVNCATCHRGEIRPTSRLTLEQNVFQAPAELGTKSISESLPTVDEILDKYLQAIGGSKKIEKLHTLTIKGTREMRNGGDVPTVEQLEIYRKSPNKLLMNFIASSNSSSQAFNGTQGWRKFNGRVSTIGGPDLLGAKRDANFYKDINFKEQYSKLIVVGKETVGGREAFVIEATFPETHPARAMFGIESERLYFDTQTGLLVRRYMEYRTPLGALPEATNYLDYRRINGVMFPMTVKLTRPPLVVTQRFADIKVNGPITDAMFDIPTGK